MTRKKLTSELTEREEEFCHYYIKEDNGARSAREAGITKVAASGWASQHLKRDAVKAKIKELRVRAASGEDLLKVTQYLKLNRIFSQAMEAGKLVTALSAVKEQDAIMGYHKDKRYSAGKPLENNDEPDLSKVSDEDLERMEREGEAG